MWLTNVRDSTSHIMKREVRLFVKGYTLKTYIIYIIYIVYRLMVHG